MHKQKTIRLNAGGGGGGGEAPPAPIPSSPTVWLYDRNQNPVKLVESGHYVRKGNPKDSQFSLVTDEIQVPKGYYRSTTDAQEKNPKKWLYDSQGNTSKQIFRGGEGPDDTYDPTVYNLGPDSMPYRHWYDEYGVSQQYAPTTTAIPTGYYEASYLAPKSADFRTATPLNDVDSGLVATGSDGGSADLINIKTKAQARRKGPASNSSTDTDTTGGGAGKTLLGE